MLIYYFSAFLLLISAKKIASLECYTCEGVTDLNNCNDITEGGSKQSCFASVNSSGPSKTFTLGIISNENCGEFPNFTNTVSNRDVNNDCYECCSKDKCNNRLCQHFKPSKCTDDVKVDCAYMNEMFDICKNVNESKKICPKFCGLCSLVDGNWADWSTWSSCDVTCDSGTQTRIRTCTNPAPAHFGMQCIGNATETRPCDNLLCPVDGGWSEWSDWGACSVTCDAGLMKRNRSCSNPYPTRSGNHCFGDSTDVEICMPGPCSRNIESPIIAFKANIVTGTSFSYNKVFVFSENIFNMGDAYNNKTGIFTAAVGGVYLFTAQLCLPPKVDSYFSMVVKGNSVSRTLLGDRDWYRCHTFDAITTVDMGDEVSVQCTGSCDSSEKLMVNSHVGNSFSGVLIKTFN